MENNDFETENQEEVTSEEGITDTSENSESVDVEDVKDEGNKTKYHHYQLRSDHPRCYRFRNFSDLSGHCQSAGYGWYHHRYSAEPG